MPRLENWYVTARSLNGFVYDHPNLNDGKHVITSSIVGRICDKVITSSGSVYELGEINESFKERAMMSNKIFLKSLKILNKDEL